MSLVTYQMTLAHTQTLPRFESDVGLRWWGSEGETVGRGSELELQGGGIAVQESEVVSSGDTLLHLGCEHQQSRQLVN